MGILTKQQFAALIANGKALKLAEKANEKCKLVPQVLLRLPNSPPSAWLLASVTPEDKDLVFGLMEVAGGEPELGFMSLKELELLKGYQGKGVYHDPLFKDAALLDIHEYAEMAKLFGQITLQFNE